MYKLYGLMAVACACNTAANLLWKTYLAAHPLSVISVGAILDTLLAVHIIAGILLYGVSMLLFLYLLSHYALSVVVPLTSLTYVLNMLVGRFCFHEEIPFSQVIGIVLILAGILFVAQGVRAE